MPSPLDSGRAGFRARACGPGAARWSVCSLVPVLGDGGWSLCLALAITPQPLGHLPGIRRGSQAAADRVFEETGEWVTGVSLAKV